MISAELSCAQSSRGTHEEELGILVCATQQQAQEVLTKLQAGWDFSVLAVENSIDATAKNGGYLGRMNPAELRPELRDGYAALKPGAISEVIHTRDGWTILKVFQYAPAQSTVDARQLDQLARRGEVQLGLLIGGMQDADAVFRDYPKPDGWDKDLRQVCEIRKISYANAIEKLEKELAADRNLEPVEQLRAHLELGQLYGYTAQMAPAIKHYKLGLAIAERDVPDAVLYFELSLGAAYLHWAQIENDAFRGSNDLDLFPPAGNGKHFEHEEQSRHAIEFLTMYLKQRPDDYQARWLLNYAYATLGRYPAGVPSAWMIPQTVFESQEDVGRFRDVAQTSGLNAFGSAGGIAVQDFDGDGLPDIIVSSSDQCDALRYFHNNGDGTFTDRSREAGFDDQLGGLNIVAADYNNDGCIDLLVLRGGWQFGVRRSLLKNHCDGTFEDVADQSGLGARVTATQTAVFADYDNDGWLDLFIGNENSPSQLFHNRGDGTFEDVSHNAGIDRTMMSKGVTAADYDHDGWVDFYVSNYNGPNFLYRNNHDGTFTDIAAQAGVREPMFSFATWFFDYDNDGWPDLFVTSYFNSSDEAIRSYLHTPTHLETLKLYRNKHDGTFEDVTKQVGLDKILMPMGANFGDFDNDGYLDMYLGMGNPSMASIMPHMLLRNINGHWFADVTASSGTGEIHKGHSIAFADLRGDGRIDIVARVGGAIPADKHSIRLFRNPGNSNDWLHVKLIGVKSNRSAIGARVHVTLREKDGRLRSIWRTMGENSSFGGNPLEMNIGLGAHAEISRLEVFWPTSNSHQAFEHVKKDDYIEIKEFAKDYSVVQPNKTRTSGKAQ